MNSLGKKEGNSMLTLEDLLRELRELGVSPGEIGIPYRWFYQLLDEAEQLCAETEENEDVQGVELIDEW
jgi:hypothetical protein